MIDLSSLAAWLEHRDKSLIDATSRDIDAFLSEMRDTGKAAATGIPTNLGTGTNEDAVIAMHRDAVVLLADTPRLSIGQRDPNGGASNAPQTYWLSLTQYAAVNIRRKTSIAKLTGSGLNVSAV